MKVENAGSYTLSLKKHVTLSLIILNNCHHVQLCYFLRTYYSDHTSTKFGFIFGFSAIFDTVVTWWWSTYSM